MSSVLTSCGSSDRSRPSSSSTLCRTMVTWRLSRRGGPSPPSCGSTVRFFRLEACSSWRMKRSRSFCNCRHLAHVRQSCFLRRPGILTPTVQSTACDSMALSASFICATSGVQSGREHLPSGLHSSAWMSVLASSDMDIRRPQLIARACQPPPTD
eukprot:2737030-Prymnesium_polylepis.1